MTDRAEIKTEAPTTARAVPLPIQFLRGLIADRVSARLGADAFVMAVVLVSEQDRLWQTSARHHLAYLADLAGFPVVNPRRARMAIAALVKDGWLRRTRAAQGSHGQDTYEMILTAVASPYQSGSGEQMTPNQTGIPHPTESAGVTLPDRYPSPYQSGSANNPKSPNTPPDPKTPPNPLKEGEVFRLESQTGGKSRKTGKARFGQEQIDTIYAAYPRKAKPEAAKRAIANLAGRIEFAELLRITRLYADARRGQDQQFTPYPATWFNAGSWQEDPATWIPATPTNGRQSLAGTAAHVHTAAATATNDTRRFL